MAGALLTNSFTGIYSRVSLICWEKPRVPFKNLFISIHKPLKCWLRIVNTLAWTLFSEVCQAWWLQHYPQYPWWNGRKVATCNLYVKLVAQDLVELIVLPGQNERCWAAQPTVIHSTHGDLPTFIHTIDLNLTPLNSTDYLLPVNGNHCISRKGGTRGGGWGRPQGDMHMVAARLGFERAMVGTGWTTSRPECMNRLTKHYSHLVGGWCLARKAVWAVSNVMQLYMITILQHSPEPPSCFILDFSLYNYGFYNPMKTRLNLFATMLTCRIRDLITHIKQGYL